MNIVFVGRSIAHFSYYQSVIDALYSRGHHIQMLFDRQWSQSPFGESFGQAVTAMPGLSTDWSLRRNDRFRNFIFGWREIRSYANYLSRSDQSDFYLKRWYHYLPPGVRNQAAHRWAGWLLKTTLSRCLLSAVEAAVPPSKEIRAWLRSHRPDVLVASPVNMRFSEEVEYLKAAKSESIPTVVLVLSWDNLTTKGIFHLMPDLLLVWNQIQQDEAGRIHRIPRQRAVITGSPFFDKWFGQQDLLEERDVFCRRIGLNPHKRFMTYLGSSANIASDETWLVKDIHAHLRGHSHPEIRGMEILVRPHPANAKHYEQLNSPGIQVWPRDGALPEVRQSQSDFYNSLVHCVATLGINTTGMIDSVIVDKPSMTLLAAKYGKTQVSAAHFKQLIAASVLEVLTESAQVPDKLFGLLGDGDSKQLLRREFVRRFVRPHGLKTAAGYMAALAVEGAAMRMDSAAIDSALQRASMEQGGSHRC